MLDPALQLKQFKPEKEYFIGIDSDGAVFDSMELKHKECFCPAFIKHFNLQPISKYAREAWDFVNLYSSTRGCNRFLAVLKVLELLAQRKEVYERHFKVPACRGLREWTQRESKLGNPALEAEVKKTADPDLVQTLLWSNEVNKQVKEMMKNVTPFVYVVKCLTLMNTKADAIVISGTPAEALSREWKENNIDTYIRVIAGQEMGKKSEHIQYAAKGKYKDSNILMIGDSPGDYKAAKDNNALFFPINPGKEEKSWEELYKEALGRFFDGSFAGEYQQKLLKEFEILLPDLPSWELYEIA